MEIRDLVNFGKSAVEAYLEKALLVARAAEGHCKKVVETYNFLAEMAPIPLPKFGDMADPYEPYEPPPAPAFAEKKAEPKKPKLEVVENKPAPKKAEGKQAEAKKAEPKKAEPKKAEPKKAEPKKAVPKKAEAKKAEPKKTEAPKLTRSVLRKMRKQDLHKVCRENGISYLQTDTNAVLAERILEKIG